MRSLEEFVTWHSKYAPYIQKVTKIMMIPLSDEPSELIAQANEIEAHNARIGFLLAEANGHLDKCIQAERPPKEMGTEADRQAMVDAAVSAVRVVRDKLEHLMDSVKSRLILAESMLAYHRQFGERNVMGKQ